jgi:hypothetical protein
MQKNYLIAEKVISIESLFPEVHELCGEYRTEGPADFSLSISREDIENERQKYRSMLVHEGLPQQEGKDSYLETLAVYRKIAEWMPGNDTILFHGSAVAVDGKAYLFAARSGLGKSTHAALWRKLLGERAVMINDDKPLIRVNEDGDATVFGTPWNGKHHLGSNTCAQLKTICLLERSAENWICEITKKDAYPMLWQQTYRPEDRQALLKTVQLIDRLQLKYYRLGCNMDISAAKLAFETMSGQQLI